MNRVSFVNASFLSQLTASSIKNILIFQMGVAGSISTLIIPTLLAGNDSRGVKFDESEASWFGSLLFIVEPLGSLLASLVFVLFGRKYSMMILNIPYAICWLLLYFATSVYHFYVASVLIGLTMGLTETPVITYVSEITEPRYRGTLISYSNTFFPIGILFAFLLGNLFEWRTAALVCLTLPIFSVLTLFLVPDTPIWLLSQGRDDEAEKALRWLRGWTTREDVADELGSLMRYRDSEAEHFGLSSSRSPIGERQIRPLKTSLREKAVRGFRDVFRLPVLKPLGLICLFFVIASWTGQFATLPYLVIVGTELKFPIDPLKCTTIFATLSVIGVALCSLTIARFKKRPIALFSFALAAFANYMLVSLPVGIGNGWPSFLAFSTMLFAFNYGIAAILWAFISEIFPFRGRSQASGIAVACHYLGNFSASKTFLQLRNLLGIQLVFVIYGTVAFFGLILGYFLFPETEGIPLEDIEKMYEENKSIFKRSNYVSSDIPEIDNE